MATDTRLRRFGRAWRAALLRQIIAVAGGILLFASFPPSTAWYLAPVGIALSVLAVAAPRGRRPSLAGGYGYGFLTGVGFMLPLLPWVGAYVGAVPWIALAVAESLFVGLFGLFIAVVYRWRIVPAWLMPFAIAACWSASEWIRSSVPFGGFPWGRLAFGQPQGILLPIASLGGAPLLSFAVALVGAGLAALVLLVPTPSSPPRPARTRRPGAAGSSPEPVSGRGSRVRSAPAGRCVDGAADARGAPAARHRGFARATAWAGALVAIVLPLVLGPALAPGLPTMRDGPQLTVAAVQGNVPRLGLAFNAQRRAVLDMHVRRTLQLAEDVAAGREPQPDVVVWPENASDIDPLRNADAYREISRTADAIGAPILVGAVLRNDDGTSTNSVIVWNPGTGPAGRHDKSILQPFGEYVPLRSFFRHFSSYVDEAGHFVPGHDDGVVTADGEPVAVATCYEVAFDDAFTTAVRDGGRFLAVPTNNATFGDTDMTYQQLAMSRVRAVEHGRAAVVAATSGVSAIIAPDGTVTQRTAKFTPAALAASIPMRTALTPATRAGSVPEYVLVALAAAAVAASAGEGVRRRFAARRGRSEGSEPA